MTIVQTVTPVSPVCKKRRSAGRAPSILEASSEASGRGPRKQPGQQAELQWLLNFRGIDMQHNRLQRPHQETENLGISMHGRDSPIFTPHGFDGWTLPPEPPYAAKLRHPSKETKLCIQTSTECVLDDRFCQYVIIGYFKETTSSRCHLFGGEKHQLSSTFY